MTKTLLQQIFDARGGDSQRSMDNRLSKNERENAEVIIAWASGIITSREAYLALNIKGLNQIYQRAGSQIRNLVKSGHVTISLKEDHAD